MKNLFKKIFKRDDKNDPVLFHSGSSNCFSNFSSYQVEWKGLVWKTSEHAYQASKFLDEKIKKEIFDSRSAYDSKMLSIKYKDKIRDGWYDMRLPIMEEIIREKLAQHPHIKKKLLQTENRPIIEASKDDSFWGWGPNKTGQNNHGKIWMKLREELKNINS